MPQIDLGTETFTPDASAVREFAERVGKTHQKHSITLLNFTLPDSELVANVKENLRPNSNPEHLTLDMVLAFMKTFGIDAGGALLVKELDGEKKYRLLDILRLEVKNNRLNCTRLSSTREGQSPSEFLVDPTEDPYFPSLRKAKGVHICPTEDAGVDAYIGLENESGELIAIIFLDKTDEALDLSPHLRDLHRLRKDWGNLLYKTMTAHQTAEAETEDMVDELVNDIYSFHAVPSQILEPENGEIPPKSIENLGQLMSKYYQLETGETADANTPEIHEMIKGLSRDLEGSKSIIEITAETNTPENAKKVIRNLLELLMKNRMESVLREKELRQLSVFDGLTGLQAKIRFTEGLVDELTRSVRKELGFHLLMIDIDHFKSVNDTHGHVTGDTVLQHVALAIKKSIRPYDMAGRYGGEEFIVGLTDTNTAEAALVAERIREAVRNSDAVKEILGRELTVSIGLAPFNPEKDSDDPKRLINRADGSLYDAKEHGRNMTVVDGYKVKIEDEIGTPEYVPLKLS